MIRLGARINFAFIAIILVMTLCQAVLTFAFDFKSSRDKAKAIVVPALKSASAEVMAVYNQNCALAQQIAADADFKKAFAEKNRAGIAQSIKTVFDRAGFAGYGTVIQDNGKVFYSSDSPAKFGYQTDKTNDAFGSRVIQGSSGRFPPYALCALSITPTVCLSSAVPLKQGILAVSTPFDTALLHGMERKIKITNESLKDFSMAFHVMMGKGVTACSPDLASSRPGYLSNLNRVQEGAAESDGRLWEHLPIWGPDGQLAMGQIIVCAPLQNPYGNPAIALSLVLSAAAAFGLSCLFTAGLASRFNQSIRFLKQRAKDLADNRHDLPSLGVLSGEWLELAEMMDTAMASPRTLVQNLKQNISRQDEDLQEKQRQVDSINYQLEQVNKQLTAHNRQTVEVNAQVQIANKQAIQIQQKLEAVLQCTSEGFLLLDPYGSILAANPKFLTWIGVQERDIAGRLCFDLVRKPGEGRAPDSVTFANPGSGPEDLINQFYPEGIIYNRAQDKQVEVLMHLQPVVNEKGNIEGYLMVLRDKSLHAEVARLRKEIVTMLSDDIHNPLVSTQPRWKAVSGQLQSVSPAIAHHLIELQKVYEQMLGVTESYLMMYGGLVPAATESMQREEVSITRLIGECLEKVSQQARTQQIMLDYKTVTGLPSIAINREIASDIILQLLDKMISVTAPGGRVRAETTVKNKEIRLTVSSSGPALAQTDIDEMFSGFIDGQHAEDTYQSRLLMYLARNNAERLGGRIWTESEAGRGTAIFLALPVR